MSLHIKCVYSVLDEMYCMVCFGFCMYCKLCAVISVSCNPIWDGPLVWHFTEIKKHNSFNVYNYYYYYYGYCYYYSHYYSAYLEHRRTCIARLIIIRVLIKLHVVEVVFWNIHRCVPNCACSNVTFWSKLRFSSSVARRIPLVDHDKQQQSDTCQLAPCISYRRKFVVIDAASDVASDL